MTKEITATEAQAIYAQEEADHVPYRVLNSAGMTAVAGFVLAHSKNPEAQNLGTWYGEAERSANEEHQPFNGYDITIEMGQFATQNGNPAVLRLDDSHFQWVVNE